VDGLSLINVPTAADFRSALRIYALIDDSFVPETVLVQIHSNDERLLASTEMPFNGGPRYAAVLSLADAFPEIRKVDRVLLHVESRNGRKIWAFVSVTSNATQDVSIVTPNGSAHRKKTRVGGRGYRVLENLEPDSQRILLGEEGAQQATIKAPANDVRLVPKPSH
jgi:hypothetical protein